MLIFLFGLLGAGKNFVGRIFAEEFGFTFYDADRDLPAAMRRAIAEHLEFTDLMRDEYFEVVIGRMAELKLDHPELVIAQALSKNRHRRQILKHFPEIKFVWVQAAAHVIDRRLESRAAHAAGRSYGEMVNKHFEAPEVPCEVLENSGGRAEIVGQIARIVGEGRNAQSK